MKSGSVLITLLLILLLSACGGKTVPPPPEEPEEIPPVEEPADPVPELPPEPEELEEPALEALLNDMTLEEKVGQLFFVQVPAENAVEDISTYHLGGYLLFGRDIRDKTANDLIQDIWSYQGAAGRIPLLIGVDEEGGTVARVSANPHLRSKKFSSPQRLLKEGEDGSYRAVTRETEEKTILLKRLGFNVNLNPVADVSKSANDFIHDRAYGDNALAAANYAGEVVKVQSLYKLGSVLKHFPGYGNNRDTHNGVAVDERPMETFLEEDFEPFRWGIATGEVYPPMPAVLVSHNIVTCMDPDLPASLSPEVHRILREDLGFDGVVMTDDLNMGAVSAYAKDGAVAVMALEAGNDLIVTVDYRTQIPRTIEAARDGTLREEIIDAACLRVLRWKLELGLLKLEEDGTLRNPTIQEMT